jgi:hypothetical protein
MMKIKLATILMVLFISGVVHAQIDNTQTITKTGTTSATFLKIAPDARAAAMGKAFVAMTGDLSSIFWNPAGLDHLDRSEVLFVQSRWIADIDYFFLAYAQKLPGIGTLGFSATSLLFPDEMVTTESKPDGTGELWDAQDLALNLSFSRRLTDRFSLGANAKYISQKIWHEQSSAVALDLGALYLLPFKEIRLGAVLSNYGNKMRLEGRDLYFSSDPDPNNSGTVTFVNSEYQTDSYPLPIIFRVGLSGEFIQTNTLTWTWAIDALHPNDNLESVNLGSELVILETILLRAGWADLFLPDTEEGLTLGGGVKYRILTSNSYLKVDYSYSDFGRLDQVQRFSLSLSF